MRWHELAVMSSEAASHAAVLVKEIRKHVVAVHLKASVTMLARSGTFDCLANES